MTVFTDHRVNIRPYTGYEDPALPIGSWIASGTATGNATGGLLFMTFRFQLQEPNPRVAQLYNLEQLAIDAESAGNVRVAIRSLNMDVLNPNVRAIQEQRWGSILISDTIGDAPTPLADLSGLPLWLGAPNDGGVDAGIRLQFINTDLLVFNATLQGYIWGTRSVVAPGGPQRPPFGFYGK